MLACSHVPQDARGRLHRITVSPATEPEDVVWENMEVVGLERAARKGAGYALTLLFLVVSFAVILAAQTGQKQVGARCAVRAAQANMPCVYY
jgi:hypothetical protein